MNKDEIILAGKEFLFPSVFHYYKEPLVVTRAKDQYVWDADGKREKTADGKRRVKDIGNLYVHLLQFVGPDRLLVVGGGTGEEWVHLLNVETLKVERSNHWPLPLMIRIRGRAA